MTELRKRLTDRIMWNVGRYAVARPHIDRAERARQLAKLRAVVEEVVSRVPEQDQKEILK